MESWPQATCDPAAWQPARTHIPTISAALPQINVLIFLLPNKVVPPVQRPDSFMFRRALDMRAIESRVRIDTSSGIGLWHTPE